MYFHVTGRYQQEIHADMEAESAEEAALIGQQRFQAWLDGGMVDMEGIWFGPEEVRLNEEVLVNQAKDATRDDPTYWEDTKEVDIHYINGEWAIPPAPQQAEEPEREDDHDDVLGTA